MRRHNLTSLSCLRAKFTVVICYCYTDWPVAPSRIKAVRVAVLAIVVIRYRFLVSDGQRREVGQVFRHTLVLRALDQLDGMAQLAILEDQIEEKSFPSLL